MPLNLRALSSFGFSFAHSSFSFFWADQTSSHKLLCLVIAWIFVRPPSRTTCILLEVFLSLKWASWFLSKNLINFDSRLHGNGHHQVCLATRPDLNKWLWSRQCFFSGIGMFLLALELTSRFNMTTINEVILDWPEVIAGFSVTFLFLAVEALPVRLEALLWDLHSLQVVPALEWVLGIRGLFRTILLFHLPLELWNLLTFVASILLLLRFNKDGCPTRPRSPILQCPPPEHLLSNFSR